MNKTITELPPKHVTMNKTLVELEAEYALASKKLLELKVEHDTTIKQLYELKTTNNLAQKRLLELELQRDLAELQLLEWKKEAERQSHIAACHWEELQRISGSERNATARSTELAAEMNRLSRAYYSGSFVRRLVFHKNGRPRGWFRKLVWNKQENKARRLAKLILFKKGGSIRHDFARWYNKKVEKVNSSAEQIDYKDFLRERISSGDLQRAKTLQIITTKHTEYIGEEIRAALVGTRLQVSLSTEMPTIFDRDLYIVVAPQMFTSLPPAQRLIVMQMEQVRVSPWLTDEYRKILHQSLAVWDYSIDNIEALIEDGFPSNQLYYVPIRPRSRTRNTAIDRDIDVLFYGSIASERRGRYINALSEQYHLKVVSDAFGQTLRDMLDRTKLVVNFHHYENAILETTRISEALSHGAHVISEDAVDQGEHEYFKNLVSFVPRGDIDAFVERVSMALTLWDGPTNLPSDNDFTGMQYHVLRALNGIEVLSFDEFSVACDGMQLLSNRLILCLPEHRERYNYAQFNRLPNAVPFHGLRNIDGWRGCANSYRFIARLALSNKHNQCLIYEDDAQFGIGSTERLERIERYLDGEGDNWDIFSGLLSDLSSDSNITNITSVGSEEFIHLDSVIGMVFGIYNRRGLEMLANFEFNGSDTSKHTIDRYLEQLKPSTITVWPPLVGHHEQLRSTLWPVSNESVAPTIDRSVSRLHAKRSDYIAKAQHAQNEKPN